MLCTTQINENVSALSVSLTSPIPPFIHAAQHYVSPKATVPPRRQPISFCLQVLYLLARVVSKEREVFVEDTPTDEATSTH